MNYDLAKIEILLTTQRWNWAKTYVSIPHEYIVRGKCNMSDDEFLYIVHAQRDIGINERWGRYNHPYLYVGGYKYWTMGDTFENTIIINRQKVFGEFDSLTIFPTYYTDEESRQIAQFVMKNFKMPIFECGIGKGKFVLHSGITPEAYYGCDPSKNAVEFFRETNKGFYQRVSKKPFEELVERWKCFDGTVVALFGSASYVMWPYLKMLADNNKDYFLMFYQTDFVPEGLEGMHHFKYEEEWLRKVFAKADITRWNNYIIVSTKKIEIKPAYVQRGLFEI